VIPMLSRFSCKFWGAGCFVEEYLGFGCLWRRGGFGTRLFVEESWIWAFPFLCYYFERICLDLEGKWVCLLYWCSWLASLLALRSIRLFFLNYLALLTN